jgi:surface antigen
MSRVLFLLSPFLLLFAVPTAANAQSLTGEECQASSSGSTARSVVGGLARFGLGRVGGAAAAALPFTAMLSDAIMNMLDCREQEKAAQATDQAVQRGEVGATAEWESESRPGVTGSSTVTAVEGDCMTVTDIVIVDGEETRAPKQMCRRPPSNRYVRV